MQFITTQNMHRNRYYRLFNYNLNIEFIQIRIIYPNIDLLQNY